MLIAALELLELLVLSHLVLSVAAIGIAVLPWRVER
jgi:hypothetical protein